jgi:hypothetical protein
MYSTIENRSINTKIAATTPKAIRVYFMVRLSQKGIVFLNSVPCEDSCYRENL